MVELLIDNLTYLMDFFVLDLMGLICVINMYSYRCSRSVMRFLLPES